MPRVRRRVNVKSVNLKEAWLPATGMTFGLFDKGRGGSKAKLQGNLMIGRAYLRWTRAGKGHRSITKTWKKFFEWVGE